MGFSALEAAPYHKFDSVLMHSNDYVLPDDVDTISHVCSRVVIVLVRVEMHLLEFVSSKWILFL